MASTGWGETYKELSAKPIINEIGSATLLAGVRRQQQWDTSANRELVMAGRGGTG